MPDYKPRRTRNLYTPGQDKPFKLSRTKVEAFIKCECCFYLDRRLGIKEVSGFPFNINSAVDELLKREFDQLVIIVNGGIFYFYNSQHYQWGGLY